MSLRCVTDSLLLDEGIVRREDLGPFSVENGARTTVAVLHGFYGGEAPPPREAFAKLLWRRRRHQQSRYTRLATEDLVTRDTAAEDFAQVRRHRTHLPAVRAL